LEGADLGVGPNLWSYENVKALYRCTDFRYCSGLSIATLVYCPIAINFVLRSNHYPSVVKISSPLHYENDKVESRTFWVCKQLNYKGEADFKGGRTYLEDSNFWPSLFSLVFLMA